MRKIKLRSLILLMAFVLVILTIILGTVASLFYFSYSGVEIEGGAWNYLLNYGLIALGPMILFALVFAFWAVRLMVRPLETMSQRLKLLAEGDLTTEVGKAPVTQEYSQLHESLEETIGFLRAYVEDIDAVLGQVARGNLTVESHAQYMGDFMGISRSLTRILVDLNRTMKTISGATGTLLSGSLQISSSAQELADNTVSVASSLQHLSGSIESINSDLANAVSETIDANSLSDLASQTTEEGMARMEELLTSMQEISAATESIRTINNTIDEIAFQTNILALNAAVEAARAGSAGRGFSVVADEVRNLAGKCAEASKNTSRLIEGALTAIENGMRSADDTAVTLRRVREQVSKLNENMNTISEVSIRQAGEIVEINSNIDRVSDSTSSSSAMSVQFAETSKELASRSTELKRLVDALKLRA
ncbi:MAG: methyl-accepting chemotaxis protein [Clostridiales Family XIII bacterium]|jgi:methyl-accepting chemotaxis protein|nr:methyl-accepting chemotaxis protein [Clostridiales Family XIII bacterium]